MQARLDSVRERIADAARRVGRDPASIRLVAISKTFSIEHVRAAARAGQRDFGENKIQEALPKLDEAQDLGLGVHRRYPMTHNGIRYVDRLGVRDQHVCCPAAAPKRNQEASRPASHLD